jgi:site-specific recombinase XerD
MRWTGFSESLSSGERSRLGGKPAPFKHHSTPHTFRHYFAITMLSEGVELEMVTRWLGHSDTSITLKHYGHANARYHDASHAAYVRAMERIEGTMGEPTGKMEPAKVATKVVRMRRSS